LRGLVSADFVPLFAADKIRIAVANFNVSFMSAGVAAKKGYFKDEGLEPEIIAMRPPVSITALVSSDIDDTTVLVPWSVPRCAAFLCGWSRVSSTGQSRKAVCG
jgi:hypothetical protein